MSSINRRHMLRLSAAAVGGAALQPLTAFASDKVSPASSRAVAPSVGLRTEHFESGTVELGTAHGVALAAMLLDLHQRREYDRSCHGGSAGPHELYLSSWIKAVTAELHSRSEIASA